VGGAGDEDVLDAPDEDLVSACCRHLAAVLPLPGTPEHSAVVRWSKAMPQYEVGHLDRVARIRAALPPTVFLAGQPYDGVGIPDCVRAAGTVADAIEGLLEPVAAGEETIR
jgi:oxygen-dependent protoporphyrinogen oxidase